MAHEMTPQQISGMMTSLFGEDIVHDPVDGGEGEPLPELTSTQRALCEAVRDSLRDVNSYGCAYPDDAVHLFAEIGEERALRLARDFEPLRDCIAVTAEEVVYYSKLAADACMSAAESGDDADCIEDYVNSYFKEALQGAVVLAKVLEGAGLAELTERFESMLEVLPYVRSGHTVRAWTDEMWGLAELTQDRLAALG